MATWRANTVMCSRGRGRPLPDSGALPSRLATARALPLLSRSRASKNLGSAWVATAFAMALMAVPQVLMAAAYTPGLDVIVIDAGDGNPRTISTLDNDVSDNGLKAACTFGTKNADDGIRDIVSGGFDGRFSYRATGTAADGKDEFSVFYRRAAPADMVGCTGGTGADAEGFVHVLHNRSPALNDATSVSAEFGDGPFTIDLDDRWSDPDESLPAPFTDTLSYVVTSGNAGIYTVTIDGSVATITPVGAGSAALQMTATDNRADFTIPGEPDATIENFATSARTTVRGDINIQINDADSAPLARDDSVTVAEDATTNLTAQVLANDESFDAGAFRFESISASVGSAVLSGGGSQLTYTPPPDVSGPSAATLIYTLSDGAGSGGGTGAISAPAVITVDIDPVADITADSAATDEDVSVVSSLLANDSFEDPGRTITAVGSAVNGTAVIVDPSAGTVRFTPAANFNGEASYRYTVTAGGVTEEASVTVVVNSVDDAVIVGGDVSATGAEDTALSGTLTAVDAADGLTDGSPFSIEAGDEASNGSASIDSASGEWSYMPEADFNGSDTFTVTVTDDDGFTATQAIALTLTPVADIAADSAATDEDVAVVSNLLANDSFEDPGRTIMAVGSAVSGTAVIVDSGAGTVRFTPDADFNGVASYRYTVIAGGVTEEAGVSVTVRSLDDAVAFGGDVSAIGAEDTTLSGTLTAVDAADGLTDGSLFSIEAGDQASNGSALIDPASGEWSYTPAADFNGNDAFTVTVTDDDGFAATQEIALTVTPIADIAADSAATDEDVAVVSSLLTNDSFEDPGRTITAVGSAVNGTAVILDPSAGTIRFTPTANFNGEASYRYTVTAGGVTEEAGVTVTVSPVDDAPQAFDDAVSMNEDDVLAGFDPRLNDSEVDSTGSSESPGGTLIQNAVVDVGTVSISGGGMTLDYVPPADFFGTATIRYAIRDGFGALTDEADVRVTVSQVDDAPTAVDDARTINEETNLSGFDPLANDTEVDSTGTPITPGALVLVAATVDGAEGTVTVNGGGTLDFVPATDFFGTAVIEYTIRDGVGSLTDTGQVAVTVVNVDDPPNKGAPFGADFVSTDEDTPITFAALANDTQVDGGAGNPIFITSASAGSLVAAHGTATTDGTTITYTPDPDYFGFDAFNYIARDSFGLLSSEVRVDVEVLPVDDAPRPVNDAATTDEDTPLLGFDPIANDVEVDSTGGAVSPGTVALQSASVAAAQGSVSVVGNTIDFVPAPNFFGVATISYTVADAFGGLSASAEIAVSVAQVDDAPDAQNDTLATNEDEPVAGFDPLLNDSEVDSTGTAVSPGGLQIISAAAVEGSATVSGGGLTVDYVPPPNFFGADTISYSVRDSVGTLSDSASILVTVAQVNDVPVAADDAYVVDEDAGGVVLSVTDNDFLFDAPVIISAAGTTQTINGETFENSSESTPTTVEDATGDSITLPNGTLSIDGGTIVYTAKDDFAGSDFFTYTLEDADGEQSTGRVDLTINPVNDPPTGSQSQSYSVLQDTSLVVDAGSGVLVGAFDIDGDAVTATLQRLPANGTLVLNADGSFTYLPNLGFFGLDSFEFFVFDGAVVNDGGALTVEIDVEELVVAPPPPDSGTVDSALPLAQVPLELVEGVDPNVLILMDDSGSMDFAFATNEPGAVFTIRNDDRQPRPRSRRSETYYYIIDLPNDTLFRAGMPSEAELLGSSTFGTPGNPNQYGVWRGRNHRYNKIYYDPQTRYRPWRGLGPDDQPFPEADPDRAVLNPFRPNEGFGNGVRNGNRGWDGDLRRTWQYSAFGVPDWDDSGGDRGRIIEDYYIPRYYVITNENFNGIPAWNTPHCLVEIRPAGEGYTDKDENADVPICEAYTNDLGGGRYQSNGVFPGGVNRTDCADPLQCTFAEEIQNFANWFVYYRNREYTVKASLGAVVADVTSLNVGYATINRPTTERRFIQPMEPSFRGTNKSRLLTQIYEINSSGGTPLRQNLDRAGRHFRCRSGDIFGSTGNSAPGTGTCPVAPAPAGLCQQQFTLLFTDGEWNGGYTGGVGNEDTDEPGSPFDGGFFADGVADTLADVAMFYYETDIHSSLDNLVPTTDRDRALAATNAFTNGGNATMHQHVTTFTVGFGVDGNLTESDIPTQLGGPPATVNWRNPFNNGLAKFDDLRHAALNGRGDYLSAADPSALERELRDAFDEFGSGAGAASAVSFNSQQVRNDTRVFRGFYNTDDNTGDLVAQLVDFENNTVVDPPIWSAADRLDARDPFSRLIVTYDRQPDEANPSPEGGRFRFGRLNSEQQVGIAKSNVAYLRGARGNERPLGDLRERPGSLGLLGDIVNSSPVFVGAPSFFGRDRAPYPVGSGELYSEFVAARSGRIGMVYVGANDGMLHGFKADSGDELFAYIPDRLIRAGQEDANAIRDFVDPVYQHQFYVDNQPSIADVFMKTRGSGTRAWATVLVGSLRAGGRGLFALDITDPDGLEVGGTGAKERLAAERVLWEFTNEDDSYPLVPPGPSGGTVGTPAGGGVDALTDADGRGVRDLGFTYSVPTIAMTNVAHSGDSDLKWAAVFGNGYNSTYGHASLFVNFIEDGNDGAWDPGDFVKVQTGVGPAPLGEPNAGLPNGLGEPRLIDLDGNGTIDFGYAGDLRGNLYRFDLTSANPDNWTSTIIFRATYTDGTPQPITTQPIVTRNTQADGVVVLIGTGGYFTETDGTDQSIQSLYGIWDRIQANPFAVEAAPPTRNGDRSLLVEQELINLFDGSLGAFRTATSNEVIYDTASVRGWYIDFDPRRPTTTVEGGINPDLSGNAPPAIQFPGERAVRNLDIRGGFLFVNTVIPRDSLSCDVSPGGFAFAINPLTGGVGGLNADSAFDINNDGQFDTNDLVGGAVVSGLRFDDAVPTDSTFIGTKRFTQLSDRSLDIRDTNTGFGSRTGRLSWRELQ